jgi:hypothetical protein
VVKLLVRHGADPGRRREAWRKRLGINLIRVG